jgi:hypothetical protein
LLGSEEAHPRRPESRVLDPAAASIDISVFCCQHLLHATAPSGLSSLAHSPESSNLKIKDL